MGNISNTTNLNIRVDSTLKKEADRLFKDLGLNMSTAINMFLIRSVKTASIPFEISEPKPNKQLKKALREAEDIEKHPEKYEGYHDVHQMFEDILNNK